MFACVPKYLRLSLFDWLVAFMYLRGGDVIYSCELGSIVPNKYEDW